MLTQTWIKQINCEDVDLLFARKICEEMPLINMLQRKKKKADERREQFTLYKRHKGKNTEDICSYIYHT